MTTYEVFFFSSGALEERWTKEDLGTARLNVVVGCPLGGLLSVAIAACAAIVLLPNQIEVTSLSQTLMPVVAAGGKLALAFVIVGIVAATFGAALETALSSGYILFSAIALPLTYLPILVVANDSQYMGDETNGKVVNVIASVYLVIILAASLAAIPLMIVTVAGQ